MDQALASPVASYARNPAAPRTSSFWLPSEGQSQTVAPPRDGSAPRSGPHSEPVHIAPRPSSPALCQSRHKGLSAGFLLRLRYRNIRPLTEGLLLRHFHPWFRRQISGLRRVNGGSLSFVSLIHTCPRYIPGALTPMLTTTTLYRSSLE